MYKLTTGLFKPLLLLIFVTGLCFTATAFAGEAATRNIPWKFVTYTEPNFTADILGLHKPQGVVIIEMKENGWGLIELDEEEHWVYLSSNRIYIRNYSHIFDSIDSREPVCTVAPQMVRIIEREGSWILIETWLGPKWLNSDAIRMEMLLDVAPLNQRTLGLPTGCEAIALAMMINFALGEEIDIHDLVAEIPRSRDPHLGFRGDPYTPNGFTVYPSALMEVTERHLGSAINMTGSTIEDLRVQLNSNRPVVVWIVGMGFYVHALTLTGYNEIGFFYNDPWTGRKDTFITYERFYTMWTGPVMDRILGVAAPVRMALSY